MQVLACRGCDAEGLLHETVNFVPVPIELSVFLILVATAARFRSRVSLYPPRWRESSASFALHLPVR